MDTRVKGADALARLNAAKKKQPQGKAYHDLSFCGLTCLSEVLNCRFAA